MNDKSYRAVLALAFNPAGNRLATAGFSDSRKSVVLWDPETGAVKEKMPESGAVFFLTFSSDGKKLFGVSGTGRDSVLRAWDVGSAKDLQPLLIPGDVVAKLAVSPCGKWIVCGARSKAIRMLEVTGKEIRDFPRADGVLKDLAYRADGKVLAGGFDKEVVFWDPATGREIARLAAPTLSGIAFTPDSKRLIVANSFSGVAVYDLAW